MRKRRAPWRGDQRHGDDKAKGHEVNRTDGIGGRDGDGLEQQHQHRRHGNHHAESCSRGNGAVDRGVIKAHHRDAKAAAADAHQHGQKAEQR